MQTNISNEIKKTVFSSKLSDTIIKIGKDFDLHIDQTGELGAEIRDILLGINKSTDFINHIMDRLEIKKDLANQIATEVNKEIFSAIKSNLQSQAEENNPSISSLEHAGNFHVEKDLQADTNNNENNEENGVTYADREKILRELENPPLNTQNRGDRGVIPPNLPISNEDAGPFTQNKNKSMENQNHTEPLVDHLLSNPAGQSEKKVTVETKEAVPQQKTPTVTTTTPIVPQKQGPDPYREEVK